MQNSYTKIIQNLIKYCKKVLLNLSKIKFYKNKLIILINFLNFIILNKIVKY